MVGLYDRVTPGRLTPRCRQKILEKIIGYVVNGDILFLYSDAAVGAVSPGFWNLLATMQEQRTDARWALNLPAVFVTRSWGRVAGVIKDFCSGGSLLTFEEPEMASWSKAPERGDGLVIHIRLESGVKQLRGYVAHVGDGFMGVAFSDPPEDTLGELVQVSNAPRVRFELPEKARLALVGLYTKAARYYQFSFSEFERRAEQDLIDAASDTTVLTEAKLLGEAIKLFRTERLLLRQSYHHSLQAGISQYNDGPQPPLRKNASDFALDDREHFEQWLALRVMVSRLEARCINELRMLQTRLDHLTQAPVGRQFNPFACAFLCQSFQHALEVSGIPSLGQKFLIRAFEKTVLAGIPALYSDLNASLVQNGILPNLSPMPEVSPTSPEMQAFNPAHNAAAVAIPKPEPASARTPPVICTAEALYAALDCPLPVSETRAFRPLPGAIGRLMLALPEEADTPSAGTPLSVAAAEELLLTLPIPAGNALEWRQRLTLAAAGSGRSLSVSVSCACTLIDALWAELCQDDRGIVDAFMGPIRKLSLPVLRLLMRDNDLMARENSPVRNFLNTLLVLAREADRLSTADRDAALAAVQRINEADPPTMAVFAIVLPGVRDMLTRQELSYRMKLERVVRQAVSEQRLSKAREKVQQELDARLAGKTVPQAVVSLLQAGWQELLVSNLVRFKENSHAWRNAWQVLDDLLMLALRPSESFDWQELFGRVKAGLEPYVESHGALQSKAFAELEDFVLFIHSPATSRLRMTRIPSKEGQALDDDDALWTEKWIDRVKRLYRGEMVEQVWGNQQTRLELVWIADDHSQFVFADRYGEHVEEFGLRDLVAALRRGDLVLRPRHGLLPLDAGVEAVACSLLDRWRNTASNDPNSALPSRADFQRVAEGALQRARNQRIRHVLAVIGIDYYGEIMQRNTPEEGQRLLAEISHIIGKPIRQDARMAWGGDGKFLLLMQECELAEAKHLLDRRLGELATSRFVANGKPQRISASVGLAEISPSSGTLAQSMRGAAHACAQAAEAGGQRIEIYRPVISESRPYADLQRAIAQLEAAFRERRLQVRESAVIRLQGDDRSGPASCLELSAEALQAGGKAASLTQVLPDTDLQGRAQALDRWTLAHAISLLGKAPPQFSESTIIWLRISGYSFNDFRFLSAVMESFARFGVQPSRFCLEICEATAISHVPDAADVIAELKKCGCRITLDCQAVMQLPDLYMRNLDIDFLRVDDADIIAAGKDADSAQALRALIEVAHVMQRKVLVRGASNAEATDRLRQWGVDYVASLPSSSVYD